MPPPVPPSGSDGAASRDAHVPHDTAAPDPVEAADLDLRDATLDPGDTAALGPGDTATLDPGDTATLDPGDTAALGPGDAALAAAVREDEDATLDLDDLARAVEAPRTLLEAIERTGLLVPRRIDPDGTARYAPDDADALRAGMALLEAGLPLGELLDLARHTDRAITAVADAAVDAFVAFVRDPAQAGAPDPTQAAARMLTAYDRMLPATEHLVAHHLRRRLLARAEERVMAELDHDKAAPSPDRTAAPSPDQAAPSPDRTAAPSPDQAAPSPDRTAAPSPDRAAGPDQPVDPEAS